MPTEAGHSSEIVASEYRGNSLPADENTPLVREASSASRQLRSCENFNCRHFLLIGLSLLSFAEVVLLITSVIPFLVKLRGDCDTLKYEMSVTISLNVVEIVNCFFFLMIIVKSPSFVGFSTVVKDLCCLPNFWTLFLFFLFYLIGASLNIYSLHRICNSCDSASDCNVIILLLVEIILEIFDFFSLMILVVFLNDINLRYTIRGRAWVYRMLKGTLVTFCFRLFVPVAFSIATINVASFFFYADRSKGILRTQIINDILFLPFGKKIVELLWQKIFLNDKCIIGKIRRNRGTRQVTFLV